MESDLLKEPWIFPQTKTSILMEEDSITTFPEWEENFQDLSGWCMDQFQTPCDFPIGELVPFKLSGTKYEGKSVSNLGKGVSENATKGVINEDKGRLKMNLFGDTELPGDKYQPLLPSSNSSFNYKKQLDEAEYSGSNTLLKLPKASTSANNSKMSTNNVNVPFHSQQRIDDLDLDNAYQNTFESTETNQPETWDMLNTVQTSGSGTFDLLSYLCEDEPRSPGGSTSTDTSIIFNSRSSIELLPSSVSHNTEKAAETDMEVDKVRRKTRSTSTITSSSSDTFRATTSRRSERTRTIINSNKVEKKYSNAKREKRKLSIEDSSSSSDSRTVDTFNYRESREKNNEASRKSRMNKKAKETEMAERALELERDNKVLKMKVDELEKLVISMRSALLQSALKKEN
ncbi:hypothetical protein M0802_001310 [Mischocyttarus mexicanus]|nr:hypothetical protein M0802_001310 [Mischocyttarus mexicanus]